MGVRASPFHVLRALHPRTPRVWGVLGSHPPSASPERMDLVIHPRWSHLPRSPNLPRSPRCGKALGLDFAKLGLGHDVHVKIKDRTLYSHVGSRDLRPYLMEKMRYRSEKRGDDFAVQHSHLIFRVGGGSDTIQEVSKTRVLCLQQLSHLPMKYDDISKLVPDP